MDSQRFTFFSLFLIHLFLVSLFSIKGAYAVDKFEWLPTESAFGAFPVTIVAGNFHFKNGSTLYVPSTSIVENGWGELGSTHIVGKDFKPVPVKLSITWFSYFENKFYSGESALSYDKILKHFQDGFQSPTKKEPREYTRLMIGLAPGGEVSLWIRGGGRVLEVDHFIAKETEYDWRSVLKNDKISRNQFVEMAMQREAGIAAVAKLREPGVAEGLVKKYRTRYHWQPEVSEQTVSYLWVETFNGERDFIEFRPIETAHQDRALPQKISVVWSSLTEDDKRYVAKISFDEEETYKVFDKLVALNGAKTDQPTLLKLQIDIDRKTNKLVVYLKNDQYLIEFEQANVHVAWFWDR